MTLTEFLLARFAEDEALADRSIQVGSKGASLVSFCTPDSAPVLLLHPKRVLAECEAKRRIVELHRPWDLGSCYGCGGVEGTSPHQWPCPTLRAIATVYADHPDYREGWKP